MQDTDRIERIERIKHILAAGLHCSDLADFVAFETDLPVEIAVAILARVPNGAELDRVRS